MIPTRSHRLRACCLAAFLFAGLAALGCRLYDLQVLQHKELTQMVSRQHGRLVKLPSLRGMIVDCNDNILAHSVMVRTVAVDPKAVRKEEELRMKKGAPPRTEQLARLLAEALGIPREEAAQKLQLPVQYAVLKKKTPEETARRLQESLREQRIGGVIFEDEQARVYPNGQLMSHVLGFVNAEQAGMDGVELFMQSDLRGQDGWRRIECDRKGKEIVVYRNEDFAPRHGYVVALTLDQTIQSIVERELDAAVQKHRPDAAVAIVMRPATGEILALANRPAFDPNASEKKVETLRNRAVTDLNEPGSTFKTITVAAALDSRIVTLDDTIWCENGRFLYGGRYLTDHESYGSLSVASVLVHSSNIGTAKIALMLGDEKLYRAARNFGIGERAFGDKHGERWPGEVRGVLHPLRQWKKISVTRVAIGHEVAVTPVQMIGALCALANGGNLMRPQIVKRVTDQAGNVVREFYPQVRRRVVDQKAAREIVEALKQVVGKEGTAARAALPGFEVAGKTGTAQKFIDGRYGHEEYVSSFTGFFPANDPEVCIYVMLDNPKGKEKYGGMVAGPVFREIAARTASYLNIRPTLPPPPAANGGPVISVANGGGRP